MCDYCRGYDGLDAAEGGPDEILIRWMFSGYPVIMVDHPHDNYGSWSIFAKTLGISTSYFSELLNGRKSISLKILFSIADKTGIDVHELVIEVES